MGDIGLLFSLYQPRAKSFVDPCRAPPWRLSELLSRERKGAVSFVWNLPRSSYLLEQSG